MTNTTKPLQNVLRPGKTYARNAVKASAIEQVMLSVLPIGPPGLTWAQMKPLVCEQLSQDLFPGGEKAGWWMKTVQLDLEAKGEISRSATSPLHFFRI